MLGKLIKNEFKANLHSIGMIYVVAIAAAGLMALAYVVKVNWISVLSTVLLIAAGAIAIILTFFCIILNYQKTLFGNQGYLSFTLPVTSGQLLAAKVITSFCWMLLSFVVAAAIFFGVYLYATAMVGDDVKAAIQTISLFAGDVIPSSSVIRTIIILLVVIVFVRILVLIAQLYFAVTLSNTRIMQKFGGFAIVIVFFAVFIAMAVASLLLTNYVPLTICITTKGVYWSSVVSMSSGSSDVLFTYGITGTLFNIICGGVLFGLTSRLMDTKVNIK